MARLARVVVPDCPHHITQQGNRRQGTFFCEDDYRAYLDLLVEWCGVHEVRIWAYCLMPNHVHLIVVPPTADALCRAIGEAHRRYTRRINLPSAGRLPGAMAGAFVAGTIRVVSDGWPAPDGGRAVRRAEPGQGEVGEVGVGLALVECGRARIGQVRRDRRDTPG